MDGQTKPSVESRSMRLKSIWNVCGRMNTVIQKDKGKWLMIKQWWYTKKIQEKRLMSDEKQKSGYCVFPSPPPLLLLKNTSSSSTSVTLLIHAHPYPIDFSNQPHISSSHRQPFLVIQWKPLWEQRTAHDRKSHFTLRSNFCRSCEFRNK